MTGKDWEGSQVLVSGADRTPTNRRTRARVQLCLMRVWHLGGVADEEEARGIPEKTSLSAFLPRRGARTLTRSHSHAQHPEKRARSSGTTAPFP